MKLYTYFRSSAAYRARIALNLKGITTEQISIHLTKDGGKQHSPAYRPSTPQRRVPSLMLDTGTALLILSPLLLPIGKSIGVDPIHFGVIVVMNLTVGTFTPPFGLNIFVCHALFKTPSQTLYIGLIPFVAIAILALMLVTYIPAISLWALKYLL